MIGKFIVYEGHFFDRLTYKKVVGETNSFWKAQNPHNLDVSKVKKSGLGSHALFNTEGEAKRAANRTTDKLIKARKHFTERRKSIFDDLCTPKEGE